MGKTANLASACMYKENRQGNEGKKQYKKIPVLWI